MRLFNLLSPEAASAELGARVKRLRLMRNLSQQQVAGMAGCSLSSLRRLETVGQATLDLVLRVAQALQVAGQFDALFTESVQTIAQAEREAALSLRKRARPPRAQPSGSTNSSVQAGG